MAKQNTIHEISDETLDTTGTVETFLRCEVRHVKGKGYAFSCYLVGRDSRHPNVLMHRLMDSDGFAITPEAGRFAVSKLRAAVERLTLGGNLDRMRECKAKVRAIHTKPGRPGFPALDTPPPSATALVPVAQAVITVNGSPRAEAAAADLRHGLATLAREEGHEAPEAYAASFSDAALDRLHADAKGDEAAAKARNVFQAAVETPEQYAAGMKLAREILARPDPKPSRKPRKPKAKPSEAVAKPSTTALVPVAKPSEAVAKPSTTALVPVAKPYVPPKVGETWKGNDGKTRVIVEVRPDEFSSGKLVIWWDETREGVEGDPFLACAELPAWRRWESKAKAVRT